VGDNGETIDATASRHPDVQRAHLVDVRAQERSMQAMAEGGHDPEFDLPRSEDEATPVFASLHDLERHLPSTPPRSDDPGSVPTEQQQQQQQHKSHKRGVRAEKNVRADPERKEYERAQRQEQRAVEGQDIGDVSSRPTLLLPDARPTQQAQALPPFQNFNIGDYDLDENQNIQ